LIKLLPYILFEKHINILALETATNSSIFAGAPPQTSLGEFTALSQTTYLYFKELLLRRGRGGKGKGRGGERMGGASPQIFRPRTAPVNYVDLPSNHSLVAMSVSLTFSI